MKKKRTMVIILCVLLCLLLTMCVVRFMPKGTTWKGGPENGLWYCKELKMQLYFKDLELTDVEELENGSFDSQSYVLIDEQLIMCYVSNNHLTGKYNTKVFGDEQTFLDAELVSLNETTWVVRDADGKTYTFCKIAHLPLHQFWKENKNVIDAYSGITEVGEVHHIDIAKEQALSLWETELGIVDVWQKEDLKVSFNYENACWLIAGTPSASSEGKTPYALIRKSGKVDAVWLK